MVPQDEESVFASYLVRFRASKLFDSRYIGFVLRSPQWVSFILASAHSKSAQPNISAGDMATFKFEAPPLPEQTAIAAVLGALDDKITANIAISRTADELAGALFMRASSGLSPTIPYGEFATVGGGGTPSTKQSEFWGGDLYWATPTDVTALGSPYLSSTSRRITPQGLEQCASPLYPVGSILMTSRATIGAFALTDSPVAVNQGFIVVNPKQSNLDMWLFHEMRTRVQDYLAMANGATFLELSRGRFKSMLMKVHTPDVMGAFGVQVRPLHDAARHAMGENLTLAELRDTLLPALMSGRLRVKDAERQVEDAV